LLDDDDGKKRGHTVIGELRNGQTERTAEWANPVHTVICELQIGHAIQRRKQENTKGMTELSKHKSNLIICDHCSIYPLFWALT